MKHEESKYTKTCIERTCESKGKSIEETIRLAIATNAPIEGNAQMIYTPAKEGVKAEYDIRTDKHDLALNANDKWNASEHMKGFITQTEYDANGFDGKNYKTQDQTKKE